ncbi:MAG: urea carboxylase-associated family protein [Mycobacteriales bacterium]
MNLLFDDVVQPGDGFCREVPAGGRVRIVDLKGNQAVDTLLYDARDVVNRYSAVDTIREQRGVYLTTGSRLLTQRLDLLATVVEDTCGRHDTVGGACAQESNVVRYGPQVRHQHACRVSFVDTAVRHGLMVADLSHNINFFMNVPVGADGSLSFADGLSAPGRHVELRAERDLLVLVSNCPQLNNPCNGYDPTPVRILAWCS